MIRRLSISLLMLAATMSIMSVVCQAAPQPLLTRHTRDAVVNGSAPLLAHLPASQTMHFDVVLALRHHPELLNFLAGLYDPKSSFYHQYVTPQEFTERFGPSQEDYDALVQFAAASGFTMTGGSRDAMDVRLTGTVGAIEKAFHVTMNLYQHPSEDRTFYAPDREPSADLPFQLWHISGLDNYSLPHALYVHKDFKVKSAAVTGSCPDQSFCGSDMRAAYYESTALTGSGQNIGLLEYAGFDIADVNTYYKNAGQTRAFAVTGISTDGTSINCLESQGCDDTEQTIDITQAGGMAPDVTTVYVYVGSSDTALLGGMSSDTPLPLNLSSSWVWSPPDPGTDDPYFEKMASQGQSFFQAAGDSGEYKGSAPWPSNSAYVMSVGGTDLETTGPGGDWASETVWEDGGGGWGTNVTIPGWQAPAADQCNSEKGDCSETYRDVPDVAANANFSFYVCADQEACTANEYGGTSFAAPMWAGYLALANQQAVANGVTAPGFIDPAIYALSFGDGDADFHDITSGMQQPGSPCVTGYNLCGGWGSPNGALLINFLTQPSGPSFTLSASPSSLTIADGNSGTSTITVTPEDGFSGSVTLAASGLPTGVTAGFSPNPTTSTSTLTLTVGSGVAPGTSTVTITGTSGSLTASTTVSLTVTASGPVVSLNPTSLTWGKKVVGTTSAAKKVVLTNTGASTLNISTITVTGDFALAPVTQTKKVIPCANGLAVPAGGTCEIKVTFTPEQTGLLTGNVQFNDNAPGSPQEVSLSGTGKD